MDKYKVSFSRGVDLVPCSEIYKTKPNKTKQQVNVAVSGNMLLCNTLVVVYKDKEHQEEE